MKLSNQTGNVVSLVFNSILFVIVLGAIGVSLLVVFGREQVINNNPADDQNGIEGRGINPEYDSIEEVAGIETTIEVPSDELLVTRELILADSLLINPGIGWIYRWSDRRTSEIPPTVLYGERDETSWRILNPGEDQYNWAILDAQLQEAVSEGKQFSFRVFTMLGEFYGGHQIPQWVLDNGAVILDSGEPDYSNCVYQDAWGRFVNELVNRYDGNPNIAFIDISGYGNFNEWSWQDQTEWDYSWAEHYYQETASKETFTTLDGQARRRLADMFIGGEFIGHTCRMNSNQVQYEDYSYPGFQKTQLVLPYAGVTQSTQYVYLQRKDIGFRHDCLGRTSSEGIPDELGDELAVIHEFAPIVFETCSEDEFEMLSAFRLLNKIPASLIHNANIHDITNENIARLMKDLGYRYYLNGITHAISASPGDVFYFKMVWSNLGNSPNYPRMGQDFQLHFYLVSQEGGETLDISLNSDITQWQPSNLQDVNLPINNEVERAVRLPGDLVSGVYDLRVAIIEVRTGNSILVANNGRGEDGRYQVSEVEITTAP